MRIEKISLSAFLLCITLNLSTTTFAQSKTDDCIIYKSVLTHLNEKEAKVRYEYGGIINPEENNMGERVEREGLHQYNFYIVDKKSDWGYLSVRDWFSKLIKDSTVIYKNYRYNKDSINNCIFGDNIKHQYKPFTDIKFSEKDYKHEKREETIVYYTPIRITFSKVLYTKDNRALVFVKVYQGIGQGRDNYVYGFVFKKNNDDWIVSTIEGEIR
jgi:hypothetical protein